MAIGQLRRIGWPAYAPRLRWVRWLPVVVVAAVTETVRLVPVLLGYAVRRRPSGRFRVVRLGPDGEPGQRHRAYAIVAMSATPGSYAVETYPEHGEARVHTLVEGRPDVVAAVNR
jgi:hypothetical protein